MDGTKAHVEQMVEELSVDERLKSSNVSEAEEMIARKEELDQLRRELVNKQNIAEGKAQDLNIQT